MKLQRLKPWRWKWPRSKRLKDLRGNVVGLVLVGAIVFAVIAGMALAARLAWEALKLGWGLVG
jgi:hypothetical protein